MITFIPAPARTTFYEASASQVWNFGPRPLVLFHSVALRLKTMETKLTAPAFVRARCPPLAAGCSVTATPLQGLTLVHFSARLKRILRHRGAFGGCFGDVEEVSGGIKEYQRVFGVYLVSETAQVELKSGRV